MNLPIKIAVTSLLVAFSLTTTCSAHSTAETSTESESDNSQPSSGNSSVDYFNTDTTQIPS